MITLPTAIADYLSAKRNHDSEALVATLTDDAVINDEGHEYRDTDMIKAWNDKASTAVRATYEVRDAVGVADRTVVAIEVAGDFPGSPVTLYFHFALREDKVAALTILS
jgi:ketosteroid isomerase-like protein